MSKTITKNLIFIVFVGFLFFVFDFILKNFVLNNFSVNALKIFPGVSMNFVPNTQMAFSIPMGQMVIMILSAIVLFTLVQYFTVCVRDGLYANVWALNFVIWGAFSNFYDRITRGFVVDFIQVSKFPVFNLSDVAILVGFVALVILLQKQDKQKDYELLEA